MTTIAAKIPLFLRFIGSVALITGCASPSSAPTGEGLHFNHGMTEEAQLTHSIARFCDSAYIALNQSQEITPIDVLARFERIRELRKNWPSPFAIAELTKASLVSNLGAEVVVERFGELERELARKISGDAIAELAKVSVITHTEAGRVVSIFKGFQSDARKWKSAATAIELTKLALFADRDAEALFAVYDEFKLRQGAEGDEKELVELTKATVLTGRTPNDLVKIFDEIDRIDQGWVSRSDTAELVKIAILTNSPPKKVYYRYAEIAHSPKPRAGKSRAMELLKYSLLSKKSAAEVIRLYDRLGRLDGVNDSRNGSAKPMTLSLVTGELLQDSVSGNHVDECNGGYARLILSIDSYLSEDS